MTTGHIILFTIYILSFVYISAVFTAFVFMMRRKYGKEPHWVNHWSLVVCAIAMWGGVLMHNPVHHIDLGALIARFVAAYVFTYLLYNHSKIRK